MFTGIVEGAATVAMVMHRGNGARLAIDVRWPDGVQPGVALGDSVAINGVCLTVVAIRAAEAGSRLEFDASHETLRLTTLGRIAAGARLNVERALRVGDRLGGHWVTGHVDGLGHLDAVVRHGDSCDLRYRLPDALAPELVRKGSIAIDGVSLTVNDVFAGGFSVTIIPHTSAGTNLLDGDVGKAVHLDVRLVTLVPRHYRAGRKQARPGTGD